MNDYQWEVNGFPFTVNELKVDVYADIYIHDIEFDEHGALVCFEWDLHYMRVLDSTFETLEKEYLAPEEKGADKFYDIIIDTIDYNLKNDDNLKEILEEEYEREMGYDRTYE